MAQATRWLTAAKHLIWQCIAELRLDKTLTPLSKADICGILPDVSPTTVEAVLGEMVRGGREKRRGTRPRESLVKRLLEHHGVKWQGSGR